MKKLKAAILHQMDRTIPEDQVIPLHVPTMRGKRRLHYLLRLHTRQLIVVMIPQNMHAGALHGGEGGGRSRPGWSVPDLDEYHKKLMAQHVTCVQPPTATFGVRIAVYKDPDGLEISVSEQK